MTCNHKEYTLYVSQWGDAILDSTSRNGKRKKYIISNMQPVRIDIMCKKCGVIVDALTSNDRSLYIGGDAICL